MVIYQQKFHLFPSFQEQVQGWSREREVLAAVHLPAGAAGSPGQQGLHRIRCRQRQVQRTGM